MENEKLIHCKDYLKKSLTPSKNCGVGEAAAPARHAAAITKT